MSASGRLAVRAAADITLSPRNLRLETEALLTQVREAEKGHFGATLPGTEHESALDLANQARSLSEGGTGPCPGCTPVGYHDEPVHEPIEDHPVP